jgi:hypothetical protein
MVRGVHIAAMRNAYKRSVIELGGMRSFRRTRPRWKENMKMHILVVDSVDVDWVNWVQDRFQWRAVVKMELNH